MIRNLDYWRAKIRELNIKIAQTSDPAVLKNYENLLEEYQRQIDAALKLHQEGQSARGQA
ncbi:MAG: hypothetical protein AB7E79_00110 [Rhodospirillaceae bacterium]